MSNYQELYAIADELRALANNGLHYAQDSYDESRYQRVLNLSARLLASLENRTEAEVLLEYTGNLAHFSPLIGSSSVLYKDNRVLLGRRADNGLWDTFGGLVDVGESAAEAARREAQEEIGVVVNIGRLLAIFDSRLWHTRTRLQMYDFYFQAELVDGIPSLSNEVTELRWFNETELTDLHSSKIHILPLLFKLLRGEVGTPYVDMPQQTQHLPKL